MSARQRLVIADYGMGNLHSVKKAFEKVANGSCAIEISADADTIASASRVVFPGQGAMPDCAASLKASGLGEALLQAAREKPFLGICIGQQMLFEHSEEGNTSALGLLPGSVRRLPTAANGDRLKIPHMGWNTVHPNAAHPLWQGITPGSHFYFVHSYYTAPANAAHSAAYTEYGLRFSSAVARDNIFALQCHPEKSAQNGLQLLQNFLHWNP